jgi:hypothetical protein
MKHTNLPELEQVVDDAMALQLAMELYGVRLRRVVAEVPDGGAEVVLLWDDAAEAWHITT